MKTFGRRQAGSYIVGACLHATLLLLATSGAAAEDAAAPVLGVRGLDDVSAQTMLADHNQWRRDAGVPELAWSDSLAQSAQAWADHLAESCEMRHSQERDYGENLAWAAGRRLSPDRVVGLWGHEKKHYDLKNNRCAERQICGHYTQMVWADTREVGCGRAICGGAEVWVCHYYPEGNIPGDTPY
jgi:uncharacterized protein YkwD